MNPILLFSAKVCLFSADHRFDDMSQGLYGGSEEAEVLLHLTLHGLGTAKKKRKRKIACREKLDS